METNVKNRGWVKNAAIIFLAVLLVLTFFSNTFMNRSLPEVATQSVSSGSITARVRGTGTVEAAGSYEVKADQTRKIQAVMVKEGQSVNQGDVLFVLGEGASEEMDAATERLRQLELNYQQTALGMPTFDYSLDEKEIEEAEKAVEDAKKAMEDALADLAANGSDMDIYQNDLKLAEAKLNKTLSALEDAKAASSARRQETWQTIEDLTPQITALETEIAALEAKIEALTPESAEPAPVVTATPGEDSGEDVPAEPAETAVPATESEELTKLREELAEKKSQLAALKSQLTAAEALVNGSDPEVEKAQAAVEEAQAELDSLLKLLGPYADDYKEAKEAYDTALKQVETLKHNLEQSKLQNNRSAAGTSLSLQDLNYQIEQVKKEIQALSGGEGNEITAPAAGIVESISYTAGNTPNKGDVLCIIQVPDLGYTLSFSVTNDQARRLRTGDSANVTNYYWGSQITATLTNIRTDPKNPQTNKLLTFDVTGDVNPGSELTIAVGSKSQNYDIIVPNSAIRSDANGSFVLAIEAQNSPLGNRYYARRVEVTVLASDDVNSAVTGDLSYGDFVITTSNRPVQAGDMVRMPD